MNEELVNVLISESIGLERNVADLYKVFNSLFKEDAYFWWTLFEEEGSHAALVEYASKSRIISDEILTELLPPSLDALKETNNRILNLIREYQLNPPSRETAFNVALKIELSAGELHFQKFMSKQNEDNIIVQLFHRLNNDDKDHAARLMRYMEEHDIEISNIPSI